MSVEDASTVDFTSIDKTDGVVNLTISDHLPWTNPHHLQLLEAKLNAYIQFIESGAIEETYPQAKGRARRISIEFLYAPDNHGVSLLNAVRESLRTAGIDFRYRQIHFNSPPDAPWT